MLENKVKKAWKRHQGNALVPILAGGFLFTAAFNHFLPNEARDEPMLQEFVIEFGDETEDENTDPLLTKHEYSHAATIIENEGQDIITGRKNYFGKQQELGGMVYSFFGKKFDGELITQGVCMEGNPVAEQYGYLIRAYGKDCRRFMAISRFLSEQEIVVTINPDMTGKIEVIEVDLDAKTKRFVQDPELLKLYKESYDYGIAVLLQLYSGLYPMPPEFTT